MYERWQDIVAGAKRQVLRNRAGDAQELEVVEEIKSRHPRYAWVGFTDEACLVRVSTEITLAKMNVETRPWCNEARKGPFVGDIHEAVLLKTRLGDIGRIGLLMDIAVPVRSTGNAVTGVLAAHLTADLLMDAAGPRLGPITTAVVTSQGQVVTPAGLIGSIPGSTYRELTGSNPQQAQWPDGRFLTVASATKGSGDFPGFGWTAVARIPADQVPSWPVAYIIAAAALISAILAGVGFWLGFRRTTA
jgi:hypothetical protein